MIETTQYGYIVVDSPRGNDATAQRDSFGQPFATLSKAFPFIRDNDTVLIYPGPYIESPNEPIQIENQPGGGAPLWLKGRHSVTIRGIGRPVIWFRTHGNGLTIEDCNDVCIEGLHFRGAGIITEPNTYYFALVLCHGYNEFLRIRNCVFSDSGDHGVAHLLGPRTTNNSIIESNSFTTGGNLNHSTLVRDGAAIALGGSGNRIYGNRVEYWLRGLELESGSFPGRNAPTAQNIIAHNWLLQCWWHHIIITPTNLSAELFDQILVEGNILQGWGEEPDLDLGRPGTTFGHDGIYLSGGRNTSIRGNDISDMWNGIGIRMTAEGGPIQDVLVTENRIHNCGRTGIHAQSIVGSGDLPPFLLSRCRFSNNKIGPCGGRGIWINGDYNVVESNDIHSCRDDTATWEGVYLEGGRRNSICRNRLIDCLPLADQGTETKSRDNDDY